MEVRKHILAISGAAALFVCTAAACALWPLNTGNPTKARSKAAELPPPAATPPNYEGSADLKLLDVDLRRPLVDAPAAAAANALAAAAAATDRWRLVGTSVDSARPMALLMSPDGTTHWFAAGEHADDGMEVKRVTSLAATIVVNGQTLELKLPQSPPDPFAVGGSAP